MQFHHSNVHWLLSLGRVHQRVQKLKTKDNLNFELVKKTDNFPELNNAFCLCDSASTNLNGRLQGKNQFAHEMQGSLQALQIKRILFSKQMTDASFVHYPTQTTLNRSCDMKTIWKTLDHPLKSLPSILWFWIKNNIDRVLQAGVVSLFILHGNWLTGVARVTDWPPMWHGVKDKFNCVKIRWVLYFVKCSQFSKHTEDGAEDSGGVWLYVCVRTEC